MNETNAIKEQYRTGANLEARIALHERFSTARQGFHQWQMSPQEAKGIVVYLRSLTPQVQTGMRAFGGRGGRPDGGAGGGGGGGMGRGGSEGGAPSTVDSSVPLPPGGKTGADAAASD